MIRSAAVIGVGEMGAPVARRLFEAGFSLTVCDRDAARLADFAQLGVRIALTPADCASCDAVLVFVSNEDQLISVATGADGIASSIDRAAPPIILVGSTVSAEAVQRVARELGVPVLDAPVSGGPRRAASGNLTVFAGGDHTILETVRPMLATFADNTFDCGPLGAGQTVKIINNMLCAANIMLMAEGYRMAADRGLDLDQITAALEVSTGRNFLTSGPKSVAEIMAGYTVDRPTFDAILSILRKDTSLGTAMAKQAACDLPVIEALGYAVAGLSDETWRTWRELGARAHPLE